MRIVNINNIGPILHYLLRPMEIQGKEFSEWDKQRKNLLFDNIHKLKVATKLFSIFDKEGLKAAGLRGLSLAHCYYPDPSLRPMRDLDILVNTKDHQQIIALLRLNGYNPSNVYRSQVVYDIEAVNIELHLSLLTAKRYRNAFDSDMLIGSRIQVGTREGNIYRLSMDNELIELVAHAFVHHELQSLMSLVDIALVMNAKGVNWDFISQWCREAKLTNMFLFALSFVDCLFDLRQREFHVIFQKTLPSWFESMFLSYVKLYFGGDNAYHYLNRKRNMFYIAEPFSLKLR